MDWYAISCARGPGMITMVADPAVASTTAIPVILAPVETSAGTSHQLQVGGAVEAMFSGCDLAEARRRAELYLRAIYPAGHFGRLAIEGERS